LSSLPKRISKAENINGGFGRVKISNVSVSENDIRPSFNYYSLQKIKNKTKKNPAPDESRSSTELLRSPNVAPCEKAHFN